MARASALRSPSRTRAANSLTRPRCSAAAVPGRWSSAAGAAEQSEHLGRGRGDVGAGAEHRGDARVVQELVVLRGDDTADHDDDVVASLLAELRDQLGHEGLVPRGLAADADD